MLSMFTERSKRKLASSPKFRLKNASTIAAGAYEVFDFYAEGQTSRKYGPFKSLKIQNSDTSSQIIAYINGSRNEPVEVSPGVILLFEEKVARYCRVMVYNNGSTTIAAGAIIVSVENDGTDGDTLITRAVDRLVGGNAI
jgi:hypothetical protein